MLFTELQSAFINSAPMLQTSWSDMEEEEFDTVNEEERTWRDPSAHKMRLAVGKWMRGDVARRAIREVCSSSSSRICYLLTLGLTDAVL